HGIRPGRLARSAQYFGEAFRQCWSPPIRPLTGCYAPAVPAGDTSNRSAQATVRNEKPRVMEKALRLLIDHNVRTVSDILDGIRLSRPTVEALLATALPSLSDGELAD